MAEGEHNDRAGEDGLRSRRNLPKIVPKILPKKLTPNLKKTFIEYCESSTIQGLNYLVKDSSALEKTWWCITVGLCIFGCIYMSYGNYTNWKEKPILVSLATKDQGIWEIPFPATTICPETKYSMECLNYTKAMKEHKKGILTDEQERQFFDYMSLTCLRSNYGNMSEGPEFFDDDYFEFLDTCKSVDLGLSYCKWMGRAYECDKLLKPILTDEGLCYNFNMFDVHDIYADDVVKHDWDVERNITYAWDAEDGYDKDYFLNGTPKRSVEPGAKNALMVAFFTPKDDIIGSCRDYSNQGMRVSLHMPNRIPRPSEVFFHVGLETLVSASILPSMSSTSSDVKSFDPDVRNCYFSKERKLRYFKFYSQNNCNVECNTNFTKSFCGCVSHYMPRDNSTPVCGLAKLKCLDDASSFLKRQDADDKVVSVLDKCDCRPLCVDITYDVEISDDEWHWYEQVLVQETNENVVNVLENYTVSAVRIFFRDSFFLPKQRRELYETSDLISNFGGILGLFTGFSLFSLAEIIYFIAKPLIQSFKKSEDVDDPETTEA
ncbi:hypothetical protein WA026_001539 [Henosepilachna vigintioctopunctata]|uniref:Uncharacterized protein n=1 Tax=Henosepilachna vigintioctopunctata TaxID=420089 RepID=A0AAW1UU65_9CUCU